MRSLGRSVAFVIPLGITALAAAVLGPVRADAQERPGRWVAQERHDERRIEDRHDGRERLERRDVERRPAPWRFERGHGWRFERTAGVWSPQQA